MADISKIVIPDGTECDIKDSQARSNISALATVATSGSYNDLSNKPTIPTVPTTLSSFTDDLGNNPTHYHNILKSAQYGSTLPASGVEGQLFFLIE